MNNYQEQYKAEMNRLNAAKSDAEDLAENNFKKIEKAEKKMSKVSDKLDVTRQELENARIEIDSLRSEVKSMRIVSVIAIIMALVSFAVTMSEELSALSSFMP